MRARKVITVRDKMQHRYRYLLSAREGKDFDPLFTPDLTPKQMLMLGVFSGKYLNDCQKEFPKMWFAKAKLSPEKGDPKLNFFRVRASLPLKVWQQKGWIYSDDPRGWFQWYCRYYLGRRIPNEDERQIKRWRAMKRHVMQIRNNCMTGDLTCRPRQRQALLQWAVDSRKI